MSLLLCAVLCCAVLFPGRSWGSLAAANSMLLIFPAARNSILTVGLGLAFDHAVVYHRFVGRFAILCVVIHGWYFLDYVNRARFAFVTGAAALGCGVVIFLTSVNYVRRNLFNLFYWSHYSFAGYLGLAYLHVPQTQPFILVGAGLYVADKLLRCLWMLWPHQTMVFRGKGKSIAQVRFPKNPITRRLGMHRVGQYYFVNFPELSLSEWHPFSVSSGPREDSIEMHIRALGDHTNRVVALAAEKGQAGESTTILIDGPYGQQNFNYRRYPMILLAAGGIGVTPVIGMLKDIYDVGVGDGESKPTPQPNAIETIYFLWAMQHIEDYECFREEIELCLERSRESPERPSLVPLIYITRSKEELAEPFIAGRPQLAQVFERMMQEHDEDQTGLVFACGPQPLVAELWDKSIEHTVQGREIDFHHEVFEF
jgi:predicted ferric reductase